MGTCLGHCFSSKAWRHEKSNIFCWWNRGRKYAQFDVAAQTRKEGAKWSSVPNSLLSLLSLKRKQELKNKVSLELLESSWSFHQCSSYVAETCLPCNHHNEHLRLQSYGDVQPLNALALMTPHNCFRFGSTQDVKSLNSTPPSSLDLEWEHEEAFTHQSNKHEEIDSDSTSASQSNVTLSRHHPKSSHIHAARLASRKGSTIESSIESKDGSRMTTPDSLEWDFVDSSAPSLDLETEQLIAEIERLTNNALQETGNHVRNCNEDILSEHESFSS